MKKLVVSPSTAQIQTMPISGSRSISPCPAITPPTITIVSPGATSPTNAPVSRKAATADQRVGPRARAPRRCLRSPSWGRAASRARRSRRRQARARGPRTARLRSRLSLRQRQTTYAATSTATTAAIISPADIGRRVRQRSRLTSAPSIDAAAASAAARSANSPKQVGPEPLTAAPSAPSAAEAPERRRQLWPQRERRRLEVVLEPGSELGGRRRRERRGAARDRARRERRRAGRARRRRRPSRAPRRPARAPRRAAGARSARRCSPTPCTSAWRGSSWLGTSEPRSAASSRSSSPSSGPPASSLATRSTAAASALPPPSPAATGMRLSIVSCAAAGAGHPRAAEVRQRPGREVVARRRRGRSTVSRPESRGVAVTSSARSIDANSEQIGCRPSSRGLPTCRTRLSLA